MEKEKKKDVVKKDVAKKHIMCTISDLETCVARLLAVQLRDRCSFSEAEKNLVDAVIITLSVMVADMRDFYHVEVEK